MVSPESLAPPASRPEIAILAGPTATGKTDLALAYAASRPGIEIVSADSLLVYRGADIGTAKPSAEERGRVPHHLIDVRDPDQPFTAGDFIREVQGTLAGIGARGRRALIVGGTGFYLKALLFGLWEGASDPALRAELDAVPSEALYRELEARDEPSALRIGRNDRYRLVRAIELLRLTGKTPAELQEERPSRPDPRFALLVVDRAEAELTERISQRTRAMLSSGLIDETRRLRQQWPGSRCLSAIGYAQVCGFLDGVPPPGRKPAPGEPGLIAEIELATRQLVKSQRTWFRGQKDARWFTLEGDRPALVAALDEIYGPA